REIDIDRLLRLVRAEMGGPVLNNRAVNLKGKQVSNHLQPGGASSGLRLALGRRVNEIELGLLHEQPAHHFVMGERLPLEGEINALRREERDRNITSGFADAHVSNGISPAPEMHLNSTDIACI